ncbi:MAG: hypothetical protein N2D54_00600 [Chloroflexota bacterium]
MFKKDKMGVWGIVLTIVIVLGLVAVVGSMGYQAGVQQNVRTESSDFGHLDDADSTRSTFYFPRMGYGHFSPFGWLFQILILFFFIKMFMRLVFFRGWRRRGYGPGMHSRWFDHDGSRGRGGHYQWVEDSEEAADEDTQPNEEA